MSQQHQKWILEDQYLPHHNSLLVISVLASITNGILLYRFCVNRYYLKPAHMSLVSISLSDFVSAFGGLVAFAMHSVNRELPWYWCQYSGVFCCITGNVLYSY
ncbi:hypothetical protein BKA69DRAFT_1098157 [Paraphysoderma sedebokerense]|nr:hypothetical protein BKA69DRAFT_1098157 [Paraphysoderma sedebokerense]